VNFKCVFSSCRYKQNNVEEEKFLNHLKEEHSVEISDISKKENLPINIVEMITISNSRIFINS